MRYIGIDIGQTGAFVVCDDTEPILWNPMMLDENGSMDCIEVYEYLKPFASSEKTLVIFEDITTLHAASKSTNFNLGNQKGAIKMACIALGLKFMLVPPKKWQEEICKEIPPMRKKDGSNDTKGRAFVAVHKLFPKENYMKKQDGIIDARLLAEYGRRTCEL